MDRGQWQPTKLRADVRRLFFEPDAFDAEAERDGAAQAGEVDGSAGIGGELAGGGEAPGHAPAVRDAGAEENAGGEVPHGEGDGGEDFAGGEVRGERDGDFAEGGGGAFDGDGLAVGEPALRGREAEALGLGAAVVGEVGDRALAVHLAQQSPVIGPQDDLRGGVRRRR